MTIHPATRKIADLGLFCGEKIMKRTILGLMASAAACMGPMCGAANPASLNDNQETVQEQPGAVETAIDPLEVTDELRTACSYLTDAEIRTLLISCRNDRDAGVSRHDLTLMLFDVCSGMANNGECTACSVHLVEQVYSSN